MVVMLMFMHDVLVHVHMRVTAVLPGLSQAPRKVHQAEGKQRPAGQVAAHALEFDER